MSTQAPPTLQKVAGQSLLRQEALLISALDNLPQSLFPPLFTEALAGRRLKSIRAMVQAWPFPCLHLGALMKTPQLKILEVIMQGLDMLLISQDVRPRRWKLRILDLRKIHENFWHMWPGDGSCPAQALSGSLAEEDHPGRVRQPLKVFIDLEFKPKLTDGTVSYLLWWFNRRKDLVQLCCWKLQMKSFPTDTQRQILDQLDLDFIQEVSVCCTCSTSFLASFGPYLGRMRNMRKLLLSNICLTTDSPPEEKEQMITEFTSHFLQLKCLQELSMDNVPFLEDHLDQVLRPLDTPLETLSITHCQLSEEDWGHLHEYPILSQLRHLELSYITLTHLSPEPLRKLVDGAAATLRTLKLESCGLTDSQLTAILPALSCCSQLTQFIGYGNLISMAILKDLLGHMARLRHLSVELYPLPLESYDDHGIPSPGAVAEMCAELLDMLRAKRQVEIVLFGSDRCTQCGERYLYNKEAIVDSCWIFA